jgi:hypothetical protein
MGSAPRRSKTKNDPWQKIVFIFAPGHACRKAPVYMIKSLTEGREKMAGPGLSSVISISSLKYISPAGRRDHVHCATSSIRCHLRWRRQTQSCQGIRTALWRLAKFDTLGIHLAENILVATSILWLVLCRGANTTPIWAIASMVAVIDPQVKLAYQNFRARVSSIHCSVASFG